jgi:zinc protease
MDAVTNTAAGLTPVRTPLANGAVISAKHAGLTRAVTISAALRAGSIYDPADRIGLAHLAGQLIDRGTVSLSSEAIAEELDSRGVALQKTVTRHHLTLVCTCLAEDFDRLLDLVAEIIAEPVFPEDEIARRRVEVITALRQDEDNPAVRAVERLMALLYGADHPYGRPARGTNESVGLIDRQDLVAAHTTRVGPASLSLAIVGAIEEDRAIAAASRRFDRWRRDLAPVPSLPSVPRAGSRARVVIPMMNKAQADVAYGFTTVTRRDPDYYDCWVMNTILGQYGLGGRLGDNIRERQGMAYYAFSSFDANVLEGPLVIRAGVSPDHVEAAIAAIDDEIRRIVADGVTADELANAKRYLIGSLPRQLETQPGIASFLQGVEHFGLGTDYDRRLPDLIGGVTLTGVHAAAGRLLDPERATIVVAGPCS